MDIYNAYQVDNNDWCGSYSTYSKALARVQPLSLDYMPNVYTIVKSTVDDPTITNRWYVALGYSREYISS